MPDTAPNATETKCVHPRKWIAVQFQSFSHLIEAVLTALWNSYIAFQIQNQVLSHSWHFLSFVDRINIQPRIASPLPFDQLVEEGKL